MFSGDITWVDRTYPDEPETIKIKGSLKPNGKVVFQYNWEGAEYLATFDIKMSQGSARRVGSNQIHASFAGVCRILGKDQIELRGGVWTEAAEIMTGTPILEIIKFQTLTLPCGTIGSYVP